MGVRIAVLIPALILFILAASFYMDVDMGTAPYDAVSFIISTHLPNVSFRVIRIVYDFVVPAIAAKPPSRRCTERISQYQSWHSIPEPVSSF